MAEASNERFTALPTAEEYTLFREAYAETYPVRPLLNAIDAKDAEIERLRAANEAKWPALHELYNLVKSDAPALLEDRPQFEKRIRRVLGGLPPYEAGVETADGTKR